MPAKNKLNARKACLHKFNPRFHRRDSPTPKNAKRTQSMPGQLCETNPISAPPFPQAPESTKYEQRTMNYFMRNEPNLPHHRPAHDQNPRNEPNFHPDPQSTNHQLRTTNYEPNMRNKPNLPPWAPCPTPKNTKRTQFPSRPPIYEPPTTNYEPNMRNEPNLPHRASPAAPAHPQEMQNEPNLRLPQLAPRSKHAKRTQSTPGQQPIANSQKLLFTKRTQFTPPRVSSRPGAPPKKCKTNPISVEAPNLRTTNNQLRTIFTKRTQLPPRSILPRWPKVSPELSRNPIPVPHISCPPNHPQICETNPIHHPTPSFPPSPLYFLLSPLSRVTARATQSQHGPRPKQTKRTQFPTINIQSTIYNIQSPGPILTNQNSLSPCCIGTWINSGEVCYAGDFVAFWICHFLEPP